MIVQALLLSKEILGGKLSGVKISNVPLVKIYTVLLGMINALTPDSS